MPEEYEYGLPEGAIAPATTKKGEEPAAPAEGEVTIGAAGVSRRQTFAYQSNIGLAEEDTIKLKHALGTRWIQGVVYSVATGESEPPGLVVVSTTEATIKVSGSSAPFKKGEEVIIVLIA